MSAVDLEDALKTVSAAILLVRAHEVRCAQLSDDLTAAKVDLAAARALADEAERVLHRRICEHDAQEAAA